MSEAERPAKPLPEGNGKPPGTTSWSGSVTELGTTMRSYYGRPVIKEPVWQPEIPWYLFTGGLAGATSALGLVARARGNDRLANATVWISLLADVASPILLIRDLGRPERFYNMLRVFKVTSPMNVGSWILALSGTASGIAAAAHVLGWSTVRDLAEAVGGALGLPLSTYTAVLLSDTAVPVWHDARHELPFLFAASSAASAGAAALVAVPPSHARPARRVTIGSVALQTVLFQAMEKRLGLVGEPYRQQRAGTYKKLAVGLTAAGAGLVTLLGRRSRVAAGAGGALVLAGEACARWSVFRAGFQSAGDPRYTVLPQRERLDARSA